MRPPARTTVCGAMPRDRAVTSIRALPAIVDPSGSSMIELEPVGARSSSAISAVHLLVTGIIGMALGPAMVSGITHFVLRDRKSVGISLSATFPIMGLLGLVFFARGLRPMREARLKLELAHAN